MRASLATGLCLIVVIACSDAVRHPLDDSESRPPTAAEALDEASEHLEDLSTDVLPDAEYESASWNAPDGCATYPASPEQGDVGTVLYRSYPELPEGASTASMLESVAEYWESDGYRVGEGSANMPEQRIVRVNGISYSVVAIEPGIEMRAFVPCY